jgi:pimeloyl-ACP methyl ester carboxylesterase
LATQPAKGTRPRCRIEQLLSARSLLAPQLSKDRVYFVSDLSGVMSLYAMNRAGSLPEPLLPMGLALQNPHQMAGYSFRVLPRMKKILVMIDENGDENYQPSFIPLEGGFPEPIFRDAYTGQQLACVYVDAGRSVAYFSRDDRRNPGYETLRVELDSMKLTTLGRSVYENRCSGVNDAHSLVILCDTYTVGDSVLYLWREGSDERTLLYGTPLEDREGQPPCLTNFGTCNFTPDGTALLLRSSLFRDYGSPTYLSLNSPHDAVEVPVQGLAHEGTGELVDIRRAGDLFLLEYNIDGCSWTYESRLHGPSNRLEVVRVLCGFPPLSQGVQIALERAVDEELTDLRCEYVACFSTATSPSQIYLFSSDDDVPRVLSNERVLGLDRRFLSEGEDASYVSFDGLRVSARLYRPSSLLGFQGARPLVLYVHGGPQSQERPDYSWFSMPLIQFLALNGFAVFVPNVRGSTGYGLTYMKQVDRDWGGKDVLDHLEGLRVLERDIRVDSARRGVVGRSYGGYMALTLASRYPTLWKAACDMFGPYDLPACIERMPQSWQPYFYLSIGHPEKDRAFLLERSPKTYLQNIACPILVVQGKRDPRLLEKESYEIVEELRRNKVDVEYLVFEDEGHDVIKLKNKAACYNRITDHFLKHLRPVEEGSEQQEGSRL